MKFGRNSSNIQLFSSNLTKKRTVRSDTYGNLVVVAVFLSVFKMVYAKIAGEKTVRG